VPAKRAATPQEITDTILFLACNAPFSPGSPSSSMGAKLPRNCHSLFRCLGGCQIM
jgi:hypothetical protein